MAQTMIGRPGTFSSLMLRIASFFLSMASFFFITFIPEFRSYTIYRGLSVITGLSSMWSLALTVHNLYTIMYTGPCTSTPQITFVMLGDWAIGGFVLASVASTAAVTRYLCRDTGFCSFIPDQCQSAMIATVLAFAAWVFIAVSALLMFCIRFERQRP